MRKECFPYLFNSLFVTLTDAIIRREGGWRWFITDIARTTYVYETMSRILIVELSGLYPEVDEHLMAIPSPRASQKSTEWTVLASVLAHLRPRTIFKFGTFTGGGTLLLSDNTKEATVYTLNLPPDDRDPVDSRISIGVAFKEIKCDRGIVQLIGHSTKFDYDPFIGQIDFVFVDASHDYESVKSDTKNALNILSPQDVVVWHDFPSSLGVCRYLLEFAEKHRVFQIYGTRLASYDPRIKEAKIRRYWGEE